MTIDLMISAVNRQVLSSGNSIYSYYKYKLSKIDLILLNIEILCLQYIRCCKIWLILRMTLRDGNSFLSKQLSNIAMSLSQWVSSRNWHWWYQLWPIVVFSTHVIIIILFDKTIFIICSRQNLQNMEWQVFCRTE